MEKKLHVLIAEPRETFREGLYSLFAKEASVAHIPEATTWEEIQIQLERHTFDLVVIHQSLITDITALPQGHFVVLTTEPNIDMYWAAHVHAARGYLFETVSGALLLRTLYLPEGAFLIDAAMSAWILDYFSHRQLLLVSEAILTPAELKVFRLFWKGLHQAEIAKQLGISPSTVAVHLSHIYEKLKLNPNQAKIISILQNHGYQDEKS